MKNKLFRAMLLAAAAVVIAVGGVLLAQEISSSAGPVTHVFAVTTSDTATYANPSGALMPMPETSVKIDVARPSLVTIHFSARGSVQPSGSQIIPIVFVECQLDGVACEPDSNPVEFLYPQFCCDTGRFSGRFTELRRVPIPLTSSGEWGIPLAQTFPIGPWSYKPPLSNK